MNKHERLQEAVKRFMDAHPEMKNRSDVARYVVGPSQAKVNSFLNCMNGQEGFSEPRARHFAEKLDVSPEWLITGTGHPDQHKRLMKMNRLPEEDQALVDNLIDTLFQREQSKHQSGQ